MRNLLLAMALAGACFAQAQQTNAAYRSLVQEAQSHIKRVDVSHYRELHHAHPELLLIDVRETEEWTQGHAAGAIHISKGVIEREIENKVPNKDATIVLYCHSGARSALAADNLKRMGYRNVYSLDGGLTAYTAAGLPLEP